MSYTRTNSAHSASRSDNSNARGRGTGRGGQKRPISGNDSTQEIDENIDIGSVGRNARRPPSNHNRGNLQSANRCTGFGNYRGFKSAETNHGNRRVNNNARAERSDTKYPRTTAERPSSLSSMNDNSSRIPKHAQNPFFQNELIHRFTNMLPPITFLETEDASVKKQDTNNTKLLPTFDTTLKKDDDKQSSANSQVRNFQKKDIQSDNFRNNNGSEREQSNDFASQKQKDNNLRMGVGSVFEDHANKSQLKNPDSNNKTSGNSSSSNKSNNPTTLKNVSMNKREILKLYGFDLDVDKQSSANSQVQNLQKKDIQSDNFGNNNGSEREQSNDFTSHKQKDNNLRMGGGSVFEDHANKSQLKNPDSNNKTSGNSSSSNKSNNPTTLKNVSINKREILKRYGFGLDVDQQSSANDIKISSRASPRVRYNLMSGQSENVISPFSLNERSNLTPGSITSQHSTVANMEGGITGRTHLNINRPVRDPNEIVPSRAEALERIQEKYEIQQAEHQAKIREKEAKKREEYLARYKHVDQGHRLGDILLDEAAGYVPGYNPSETVEEVRQRQQEELRRQTLAFQEQQREEEEKQKRLEEKKAKQRLDKNKRVDAGYRLGSGDSQALGNHKESLEDVRQRPEEWLRKNILFSQESRGNNPTENVPEMRQRQEEWLRKNTLFSQESRGNNPTENVPEVRQRQEEWLRKNTLTSQESRGNNPTENVPEVRQRQEEWLRKNTLTSQESRGNNPTENVPEVRQRREEWLRKNTLVSQESRGNNPTENVPEVGRRQEVRRRLEEWVGNNTLVSQESRGSNPTENVPEVCQRQEEGLRKNTLVSQESRGNNPTENVPEVRQRQEEGLRKNTLVSQESRGNNPTENVPEVCQRQEEWLRKNTLVSQESRGNNPTENVPEVRQRQKDELRRDLGHQAHQERDKKKIPEAKQTKELLDVNQYHATGLRLGQDDNQGNSTHTRNIDLKNEEADQDLLSNKRLETKGSISPELLLEGETEEEFLQRQEEQLILEIIIQSQVEFAKLQEQSDISSQTPQNLQPLQKESASCVLKNENGSSRDFSLRQPNRSAESSGAVPKRVAAKFSNDTVRNQTNKGDKQIENTVRTAKVEASVHPRDQDNFATNFQSLSQVHKVEASVHPRDQDNFATNFQSLSQVHKVEASVHPRNQDNFATNFQSLSQVLEDLHTNASQIDVSQGVTSPQTPQNLQPMQKEPASCVLKNKNGAVLVLRPSSDQLNQALARRMEVQDEMDKLGCSALYKPTAEQVPLYTNNRFDKNFHAATYAANPATGAIPKTTSRPINVPVPSKVDEAESKREAPKEEKPAYDHKAELRAARLRFQQNYEETLKKFQAENNKS